MGEYAAIEKEAKLFTELCVHNDAIDPNLFDEFGVKRGLRDKDGNGVLAGITNISRIDAFEMRDGVKTPCDGKLWYRGYNVYDLIRGLRGKRYGFEEVAYLLLLGDLPNEQQLHEFTDCLTKCRALPSNFVRDVIMKAPSKDLMNSLTRSVLTLASYDDSVGDNSLQTQMEQCIKLISVFPMLAVYGYHAYNYYLNDGSMYIHRPRPELSAAENLLQMLRPDQQYTPLEAHVLDIGCLGDQTFQRAGPRKHKGNLGQGLAGFDQRFNTLFLAESAKIQHIVLLLGFFPGNILHKIVKGNGFGGQHRVGIQLRLHKFGTAQDGVDVFIHPVSVPNPGLQHANETFGPGAVNAPALETILKMSAQAFFTVLPGYGISALMVRANQLIVVGGIDHPAGMPFLLPISQLQKDAGCQLEVEVVQMANIRLKILQHLPQLFAGIGGINGLYGVKKLCKLRAAVKVHVLGIGIDTVAYTAAGVLHAEILDLMAL